MALSSDAVSRLNGMCPAAKATELGTAVSALETQAVALGAKAAALESKVLALSVVAGAEALDKRVLTITVKDAQGNAVSAAEWVWIELISAADAVSFAFSDDGKGEIVYDNQSAKKVLVKTDAAGVAEIGVTDAAAETVILALGSGPGTKPMVGVTLALAFAA